MKKIVKKTKKIVKKTKKNNSFIMLGKCYLFRTVTYHALGRVKDIIDIAGTNFIELELGSSWVADSGQFSIAINEGKLNEVEVIKKGQHLVNPASCCDVLEWIHPLPTETK